MMIYWIAILSVLIAIETVFAGTSISMYFPAHPSSLVQDFFTTYRQSITPKRDVLFLRVFIVVGVSIFVMLMRWFSSMKPPKLGGLKYFTVLQAAVVFLETFAIFKFAVYHYPVWQYAFLGILIASAGIKVFFPEILKLLRGFNARLKEGASFPHLSIWLIAIGMLLIGLIIWVPDVEGAVARMFLGEDLHHIDWLLMSAGWAHMSGNILGVDNISRYGIGAPILVAEIARHLLGRFDYVHAVIVMMIVSIGYYWIWFYSLRLILKDTAWAFIAIFFGLRLHFFHSETFPFIFTYPQVTPLRFFCDSLFFLFLILHAQKGRMCWLYLASAVSGFSVFYITGEGLYTLVTFYIFLGLREIFVRANPSGVMPRLEPRQISLLLGIPWAVLLSCLWMVIGAHIFDGTFWFNQFEYVRFYQAGNTTSPMINNLAAPFITQASIAFVLPVVYLGVLVVFIGKMMEKSLKPQGLIMACACVFLLMSYHYHAMIANNMPAYLRNGVIIAMLTVYFLKELTASMQGYRQRLVKLACGLLVMLMIVTTHQFLLHPNIFNLSRNPMTHPVVTQFPVGRNSYFNHLFISYPDAFKLPVNGLGEKNEMLLTENDFANDQQLKDFFRQDFVGGGNAEPAEQELQAGVRVP